ncbi:MAG: nucleotidyl transferase AbiEii/AbiGii toxin family protein [Bryobacterales bacterium]|nr:nucleotidyl transferase AbiEii/AbiGii toxin family protein [Bryobacterales bacterium]
MVVRPTFLPLSEACWFIQQGAERGRNAEEDTVPSAQTSGLDNMKTSAQFRQQAAFLRESSGSTKIEKTLLKALKVLKLFSIPHYVCSGFAVQERGYPRFTVDVDIIVPDVESAIEKLSINGFKQNQGSRMTVTDRETKVEVDLLPGGKRFYPSPLALPVPTQVSDKPQILPLETLIAAKLSTYIGRGIDRSQDYADVVQLVKINRLPRDFGIDPKVSDEYHKLWDALHQPDRKA